MSAYMATKVVPIIRDLLDTIIQWIWRRRRGGKILEEAWIPGSLYNVYLCKEVDRK